MKKNGKAKDPPHTRTHARAHAHTRTHAHTHTRTHARTHARAHTERTDVHAELVTSCSFPRALAVRDSLEHTDSQLPLRRHRTKRKENKRHARCYGKQGLVCNATQHPNKGRGRRGKPTLASFGRFAPAGLSSFGSEKAATKVVHASASSTVARSMFTTLTIVVVVAFVFYLSACHLLFTRFSLACCSVVAWINSKQNKEEAKESPTNQPFSFFLFPLFFVCFVFVVVAKAMRIFCWCCCDFSTIACAFWLSIHFCLSCSRTQPKKKIRTSLCFEHTYALCSCIASSSLLSSPLFSLLLSSLFSSLLSSPLLLSLLLS